VAVVVFGFFPWLAPFLNLVLILLGLFLILLILIQRGKGGGLIGALGGTGGSSPFGSRAGDQFTRITIYVACVWLLLTMVQVRAIQSNAGQAQAGIIGASSTN
jgi:preprotein translocase subunit SecG